MTKEEELLYSEKYYKGARKFGLFFSILIIFFGIIIILIATILLINRQTKPIIIVSIIMYIASLLDITLGIRFVSINKKRLKLIKPSEAALRYCKIYGIKTLKK